MGLNSRQLNSRQHLQQQSLTACLHLHCTLQVVRRGAPPLGGGEVVVRLPVVKQLLPVSLVDEGMVKRIRGVAFSARVSPQCSNRMVDGARSVLNEVGWRGRPGVQAAAWMHGCLHAG